MLFVGDLKTPNVKSGGRVVVPPPIALGAPAPTVVEEAVVTVVDALFLPPPDPHATSTSKAATVAINGFTAGGYPPAAVPARLTSTPNMRCAMRRIWISSEPSVMR